jgi:osmotically-inducible protein OsmY
MGVGHFVRAILLLCALAFAGCSTLREVHECGWHGCPGDPEITARVKALLDQHVELRAPNQVDVQTLQRVVYLTGQVSTDLQRQIAQSVAGSAAGVKKVVNNIALPYEGR